MSTTQPKSRQSSCQECHRLKLKCDKMVPCGSCVRRGCISICPTGTLRSTGRGKRSVMSDVPELTAVISEMGERIRQLEQAVADTRSGFPSGHPLLSATSARTPLESHSADALGSFSVNEDGHAVYFGPTAGTEALFSIEGAQGLEPDLPNPLANMRESFPFSADGSSNWDPDLALEHIYAHLPLEARAWTLCETYYRNGCWTGMPVNQSETAELLDLVYHPHHSRPEHQPPITTQKMAVLILIFALGSLVDLTLPPYNSDADAFFDLGIAAMSIQPVFESPTVATIQALTLIASYHAHGGARFSMDAAWSTISLATNISQRLGLDRESFSSKLSPIISNRCRALFWEIYSIETIYGLSVGRPTGTFLSDISCPYPPDDPDDSQPFVKIFPGYRQARWDYTKDVTARVMEAFLKTTKPTYETVLDLDQRIRKYILSSPFESFPTLDDEPPFGFIQRHLIPLFAKIMLLYIHNNSFVEAMRGEDPFSGPYSPSFLACYRSASEVIKADIRNFTTHPLLFTRWWAIWKSLFSSAVIVGTVATKYPRSKTAMHAIVELFTAVDLIEKGAVSSGRARSGLALLQRLRDKAIGVYSQFSGHNLTPPPGDSASESELEIFAGYTRVVAKKVLQRGIHTPPRTESRFPSPPSFRLDDERDEMPKPAFDPSIVQYFDNATPFVDVPPLAEPQLAAFDAGLFFTFPPDAIPGLYTPELAGHEQIFQPDVSQEMQWAEYLQTL
ncbi:fungal-specific transcription factor domain-containing protein [Mycena filopes]|nr:fungal-specific transcription factor domain-containing protein [Mycena filopes]